MRGLFLNGVLLTAIVMTATPAAAGGGSLDKDLIRRVIRAHIPEIRVCYNEGLQRDPQMAGKLMVDFEISTSGEVSRSEIASSTVNDAKVEACVAAAVKRWLFPRPDGGSVEVSYPFELEPG